jgi:hypothetical protein
MSSVILFALIWYLAGVVSMSYWLIKANDKYSLGVSKLLRKHLSYVLWSGLLGPVAFFAGHLGYQFSRME